MYKTQKLIRERVLKGDFRKVYTLEEIWKWIQWGLKKGIINKSSDEKNIENVMKGLTYQVEVDLFNQKVKRKDNGRI